MGVGVDERCVVVAMQFRSIRKQRRLFPCHAAKCEQHEVSERKHAHTLWDELRTFSTFNKSFSIYESYKATCMIKHIVWFVWLRNEEEKILFRFRRGFGGTPRGNYSHFFFNLTVFFVSRFSLFFVVRHLSSCWPPRASNFRWKAFKVKLILLLII